MGQPDSCADFDTWLKGNGYLAMSGQIVAASIIAVPRQCDTDEEKAALKEGKIPEVWRAKPPARHQIHRQRQQIASFSISPIEPCPFHS